MDGRVVKGAFAEQVERAFENLRTALAAQDLTLRDVVQLRTYVVSHDFEMLGAITKTVAQHWGDKPPTQTLLGVARLASPDMLFEVEAVAAG